MVGAAQGGGHLGGEFVGRQANGRIKVGRLAHCPAHLLGQGQQLLRRHAGQIQAVAGGQHPAGGGQAGRVGAGGLPQRLRLNQVGKIQQHVYQFAIGHGVAGRGGGHEVGLGRQHLHQAQRHPRPDALPGHFAGVGIDGFGFPRLAADGQRPPGQGAVVPPLDRRREVGDDQAGDHAPSPSTTPLKVMAMGICFPAGASLFFTTNTCAS